MKRTAIIAELVKEAAQQEDDYFTLVEAIAILFPKNLVEQLGQLVNGPIWDGDVISKADRGELFDMGLAIRVCSGGEQGFTGATYTAWSVLEAVRKREAQPEPPPGPSDPPDVRLAHSRVG